jgi:tetratricopeptide (TPR) repeat protein
MDADETVVGEPNLDALDADAYLLRCGAPTEFTWWNPRIFRDELDWRYVGVRHEYAEAPGAKLAQLSGDYYITATHGGSRSRDPEKYRKDALAIEAALIDEPNNTRYAFYLGQSWFCAGEFLRAKEAYERRIKMGGGYLEEIFYSMYRIGACHASLGNYEAMLGQMLLTFDKFPHRAEPIYFAAKRAEEAHQFRLGYELATIGAKIEMPSDLLFVEADVYTWRMIDVLAVCGYWTNNRREARALNERLLFLAPESEQERIAQNLEFCIG